MESIDRTPLFTALTRPQMFAGVTYNFFIINGIITTELFLIFHTFSAIVIAVLTHVIGVALSLREPRIFDLWITNITKCPRIRNYGFWRCNSYAP